MFLQPISLLAFGSSPFDSARHVPFQLDICIRTVRHPSAVLYRRLCMCYPADEQSLTVRVVCQCCFTITATCQVAVWRCEGWWKKYQTALRHVTSSHFSNGKNQLSGRNKQILRNCTSGKFMKRTNKAMCVPSSETTHLLMSTQGIFLAGN
jgi:hypothetical protein